MTVAVADLAGNPGSTTTTFQMDTIPAAFTIVSPAYVKKGTFSINIISSEQLLGSPSLTIKDTGNNPIDTVLILDANPVFWYQVTIGTNTGEGTATVEVMGTDTAGNISTQAVNFLVDTTAPILTIIPAQDPSGIGTMTITVTHDNPLSATPSLTIKDNANATITAAFVGYSNGIYTYQATITTACADGTATITVNGTDTVGNPGSDMRTFQISLPRILTPTDGISQVAIVTTIITPFVVKLTDSLNRPIQGQTIKWTLVSAPAMASLLATITTTNADGFASTTMTLGTKTGIYIVIAEGSSLKATFTATAMAGVLHHINISPTEPFINTNQLFPFTAGSYDQFNNEIAGLSYHWAIEGDIGSLTMDSGTSTSLLATSTPAVGTISAGTLTIISKTNVSVVFGQLTSVTINPATKTVEMLGSQSFTASARNQYGFPIMGATCTWTLKTAGMGTIDTTIGQTVVFTATKTGTMDLEVAAAFGTRTATATTKVIVVNGAVHHIDITPATTTIEARGTTSFTATAYNQYGYELSETADFGWQIVEGSGTVSGGMMQTNDIVGTITLTASTSTVTGTATVTVIHGSVSGVSIFPATATVEVIGSQSFTASAVNRFGHPIPTAGLSYTWGLSGSIGGNITTDGIFTAGSKTGKAEVTAEAEGKGATATVTIRRITLVLSPATCTLTADGSQTYAARTTDSDGNYWDEANITWSVNDPTGTMSGSTYYPGKAGIWTITGTTTNGKAGTATVVVNPGTFVNLKIIAPATVTTNATFTLTVTLHDCKGNPYSGIITMTNITKSITPAAITLTSGTGTATVTITKSPSGAAILIMEHPATIYGCFACDHPPHIDENMP
ncbi:MAG: hypothetical protein CVV33_05690 [Methanomicrobiales archaeon HGW-Methanomicrobiales-4]|nr:MAG: hypothetical protein CVV33_05690 [Methanomicrobiales archaeon HGW-Methanomicrobiales-4]